MTIEPSKPLDVLNTLTVALTQLRQLAALPSADPYYASAAEQVAAIVAELQRRAAPTSGLPHPPSPGVIPVLPEDKSGIPSPPSPGAKAESEPPQQDSGFPDPPSPG